MVVREGSGHQGPSCACRGPSLTGTSRGPSGLVYIFRSMPSDHHVGMDSRGQGQEQGGLQP